MNRSRLNELHSKMDLELGTSYIPKPLSSQPKLFSPGMLQLISKSERTFTRLDERLGHSSYLECVQNTLLNLEALASAVIDGAEVDLMALLLHDMKKTRPLDPSQVRVSSSMVNRAVQYRDYIEVHNSCSDVGDLVFDRDLVMRIHEEINYPKEVKFKRQYRGSTSASPSVLHPQLPQSRTLPPERIDEYMEDLFKFCNTDYYTPQIQAGLAHFQLEYIRPFKSRVDALGRHMSYLIYAKRDFTRNIIVAVAIESIRRIDKPQDGLKASLQEGPGRQSPLELWIYHGANLLLRQVEMVEGMERSYAGFEEEWRSRVAKVRKEDICDIMLHDLLAHPVINAKYVSERCGKTLPAANDALKKLTEASILAPVDMRKRNRYFYAVDVLDYYLRMLDDIMPHGWLPGVELFNS